MMNNRNLLLVAIGLLAAVPVFAGAEQSPVVAQVVKHVVPYETFVWSDDSTEIVVLVRVKETGLVKELGVEQMTGTLHAKSKFDMVRLLELEPFVFEGREISSVFGQSGETKES